MKRTRLSNGRYSSELPPIMRFLEKVMLTEGCWLWTGALQSRGYGSFNIDGHSVLAHQFSYEYFIGPIPDDKELDHSCRNHPCVNPSHLEPVAHLENVRRGNADYEKTKTHCPKGHPYDEENTRLYHGRRFCRMCHREESRLRMRDKRSKQRA